MRNLCELNPMYSILGTAAVARVPAIEYRSGQDARAAPRRGVRPSPIFFAKADRCFA